MKYLFAPGSAAEYAGKISIAVCDPDVRTMLMLYSQAQKSLTLARQNRTVT